MALNRGQEVMKKFSFLTVPLLTNHGWDVMCFIAICVYLLREGRVSNGLEFLFRAVKISLLRMFVLSFSNRGFQGLEYVMKLPEERRYVASADDQIDLALFPYGLLVFAKLVSGCLHRTGLQIDPRICQVIGGVVDRKPNLTNCTDKVRRRHVGHALPISGHNFRVFPLPSAALISSISCRSREPLRWCLSYEEHCRDAQAGLCFGAPGICLDLLLLHPWRHA